nr:hypothetical protein BDDEJBFL_00024 [Agrobacterium fabrum]UVY99695.1 hypothetical protein K4M19_00005 [Agrobacterium fabrum]
MPFDPAFLWQTFVALLAGIPLALKLAVFRLRQVRSLLSDWL